MQKLLSYKEGFDKKGNAKNPKAFAKSLSETFPNYSKELLKELEKKKGENDRPIRR
jgi:hypothetical protein